jgi:hypothetical protein
MDIYYIDAGQREVPDCRVPYQEGYCTLGITIPLRAIVTAPNRARAKALFLKGVEKYHDYYELEFTTPIVLKRLCSTFNPKWAQEGVNFWHHPGFKIAQWRGLL